MDVWLKHGRLVVPIVQSSILLHKLYWF